MHLANGQRAFVGLGISLLTLLSCSAPPRFSDWELPTGMGYAVTSDRILIEPIGDKKQTAILFYPGGQVHPTAYIPTLASLASQGYTAVIARMPFDLAVFDPDKGQRLKEDYPYVQKWVLMGHSLGGAMAIRSLKRFPESFQGLVLLAAYGDPNASLVDWNGPVLSISADLDGLATPPEIEKGKSDLPATTRYVEIAGGNHAQFGEYGLQTGDGQARISGHAQRELTAQAISEFLNDLENL
ncbi:MAG: alpha/beta hydrolase [Candidatus Sericytochromatia bacterium]